MLDVDRRDDVDAGVEELADVLPPFLVAGAGDVGVGEFVDERDLRAAREERVEVEVAQGRSPVRGRAPREHLQPLEHAGRMPPPVRLDDPDDDVGAARPAAGALREHRHGLADAGGGAEIDPQPSARHCSILLLRTAGQGRERGIEQGDVHPVVAEEAERGRLGVLGDEAVDLLPR